MIPSLFFYLAAGALAPAVGFSGVALAVGFWAALVGRRSVLDGRTLVSGALLWFVPLFLVLVIVSAPRWDPPFDLKDPFALILFFCVIPSLLVALCLRDEGWLDAARRTVRVAFVLTSVAALVWGAAFGVNWDRNYFFLPILHKNSVAAVYEVLLMASLLHERWWHRRAALAGVGLLCLAVVGSKTALGLALAMIAVILFRWVGVALVAGGLAASLGFIRANLALNAALETVVQRFILWAHAWDQITASSSHWWFGVGPGTFVAPVQIESVEGIAGTHNLILQLWHSYGLLGLVLFGVLFWRLYRRFGFARSPFLMAFWLFNLHAMFDVGWVKGPGFVASAALGLGIADVLRRESQAAQPRRP
jgi:O-antigen ligase